VYRALSPGAIGVKAPFAESARLAAKYGFAGVDVGQGVVDELGIEGLRSMLDKLGLVAAQAGMPVNFREDEETFKRDLDKLPAFAQTMAQIGCERLATWFMPWHATLGYEERFAQMTDRVRRMSQAIEPSGLRFGLEFVGPETLRAGNPNPFIHDIDGLLELIAAVDMDNVGFLLDAFHWYTSGGTKADLDKLSEQLVIVVHVNDGAAGRSACEQIDQERAMPGETGVIDIATFMGALDGMGYSGPVIVEPFSQRVRQMTPEEAVRETAVSLDRIWQLAGI
jgi:sugar phosphate isomerase/epimerase